MYADFQEKIFPETSGKKLQTFQCSNVTSMTCLIGEVLDEPGMKSNASFLGTFFVYTLEVPMPIFKKKSPLKCQGKSYKLFNVVMLLQWKDCNFFPDI